MYIIFVSLSSVQSLCDRVFLAFLLYFGISNGVLLGKKLSLTYLYQFYCKKKNNKQNQYYNDNINVYIFLMTTESMI